MCLKKPHLNTFIKYITSYFILLIIPILIINIIVQTNIFNKYKTEIINNTKNSQENVSYNLENGFMSCSRIVDQLIIGNKLTIFSLDNTPGKAIELIQNLKGYAVTSQFFDHVFVHFFDDKYIYSESSSYTKSTIFNIYAPQNISSKQLMSNLYNITTPVVWKDITFINNGAEKKYILYSFPLTYSSVPKGFVSFFIDSDKVSSLLDNSNSAKTSLLVDFNKNILYDSNVDEYFYTKENFQLIKDTLKNLNIGDKLFKSDKRHAVYANALGSTGIVYFSIIETSTLFKNFITAQRKIYLGIFVSLIIGSFIIYLLMKLTYNPILKLKKLASSINRRPPLHENNEFELIKSTLNYFFERNTELENELENNLPIRQYYLLNQLINGNIPDKEKFLESCGKSSIKLTAPYHTVITIKSSTVLSNYMDILASLGSTFTPISYNYVIEQPQPSMVTLIIGSETSPLLKSQEVQIQDAVVIAIGSTKDNVFELYKSYIESRSVSNLTLTNSDQNVIVFNETLNVMTNILISKCSTITKNIKRSLRNDDSESLEVEINNLLKAIDNNSYPIDILKKIFIEILVMFSIYFEKNKDKFEYVHIDFQLIYEIEEVAPLNEVFSELMNEMLTIFKRKSEVKSPSLSINSIKQIIEQNYMDYTFSLQSMATNFGVSVSYLSQYFKDKTGSTVLDYITQLKMEESTKLLRNTDLPLKEIAEHVGYINISSFIRRFKQITGITPGEYKRKHQAE